MNLEKIGEEIKRIVESLDKGTKLKAVIEEEDGVGVFLSKRTHSNDVIFSKNSEKEADKKGN